MSTLGRAFHKLKVSTADFLCQPRIGHVLNRVFQDQIPTRDGLIAFTRGPGVSDTTRAMIFWGVFESGERRMVLRHFSGDLDTVELGSGIGVISAYAARRLHPSRRLVCVEANPALIGLIEQNVAINASHSALSVIHGAIDYSGAAEVSFAVSAAHHLASRVSTTGTGAIAAPALRLTDVLDRAGITGRFALITDIEGAEHDIARYDAAALERCDQIIAELHTRTTPAGEERVDELITRFQALGFHLVDRHGGVCTLARRASR